MELVTLERDQMLYQAGQAVPFVYFPVTASIEEALPPVDGEAFVLRRIGPQAMAGSCVLGDAVTARSARVCETGQAYRLAYQDFVRILDEMQGFRELVIQDAARACVSPLDKGKLSPT